MFNKTELKIKCQKLILAVFKKLIFLNVKSDIFIKFIIFFKLYNQHVTLLKTMHTINL